MSFMILSPTTSGVAATVLDPIEPEARTYSEPNVARAVGSAMIDYDVIAGGWRSFESIAIDRVGDALRISGRTSELGELTIPAPILPTVLAEIDRIMSGDDQAPFEPISARAHVVAAEPAPITGVVPTAVSL